MDEFQKFGEFMNSFPCPHKHKILCRKVALSDTDAPNASINSSEYIDISVPDIDCIVLRNAEVIESSMNHCGIWFIWEVSERLIRADNDVEILSQSGTLQDQTGAFSVADDGEFDALSPQCFESADGIRKRLDEFAFTFFTDGAIELNPFRPIFAE